MKPTLTKHNYRDILNDLNAANLWLNSIGVQTKASRLEKIINNINLICEHYDKQTLDSLIQEKGNLELWFSLMQSDSFICIYGAFNTLKSNELPRGKLKNILGGPFLPTEEEAGDASVNPRNCLFELELAARMKSKGITVTGFDDVIFKYREYNFNVECKRIFKEKRIKPNIEKAYEQLKQRIENKTNARGIIALSVEKILETDGLILQVSSKKDVGNEIVKIMNAFIHKHKKYWESLIVDIKILGVFIVFKFITIIKDERNLLTSGFQLDCIPLLPPQANEYYIFKSLCEQLY